MPPAVGVEHLFARVEDLDRATRRHGQPGDAEFEVEGLGFAAEGPPYRRLNDPNGRGVEAEYRGQLAVQVVRHLGGRPDRQAAVLVRATDGAVRFDRRVRGAFEEIFALDDDLRGRHALVHLPETEVHPLGHVAVPSLSAGLVDERLFLASIRGQRLRRVQVGGQLFVFNADERQGLVGGILVHRRHCRHAVPDVAYAVHAQGVLVRCPWNDAVAHRHVFPGNHGVHALQPQRPRRVDGRRCGHAATGFAGSCRATSPAGRCHRCTQFCQSPCPGRPVCAAACRLT